MKKLTIIFIFLSVAVFAETRMTDYNVVRNNMFASLHASIDLEKWRASGIKINSAEDIRMKFIGTMDKMYKPEVYTSNPYRELEDMVYDLTSGSYENSSYRLENFAIAHMRGAKSYSAYPERKYIITRIEETKYILISADVEPWGVEVYNDGQYKVLYHNAFRTHAGHKWNKPLTWEYSEFESEDGDKNHKLVLQSNSLMIFPATKDTARMVYKDATKKKFGSSMPQYKYQLKLFSLLKITKVERITKKTGDTFVVKVDIIQSALVHKDKDTAMYSIYYQ